MAKSGVSGDFAKLKVSTKRLAQIHRALGPVGRAVGEELVNMTKDRFREEKDPYGKPWAPKKASDGRKILSGPTSRLKNGWKYKSDSSGDVEISPSVEYAAPHQSPKKGSNGRLKRPRRMMVPSAKKGLPQAYARELREVIEDVLEQELST